MPAAIEGGIDNMNALRAAVKPRRLVLCFDGTSNKFQGDRSDTNIVKIYQMLERNTSDQFHYYQPGIGTYSHGANENAGSIRLFPETRAKIYSGLDEMFGISFVDHVKAGYRFLMRYYEPGDDIYMLGFSRGAYTARFLAEMIHDIGLLSRGNEEMVHFAWDTFSTWQESRGNVPRSQTDLQHEQYMKDFKRTFCRPCLHIHFLGLFDCVNSVGRFDIPLFRKSYKYITTPAAQYIRHAVSVHERRLKFKPALCLFEQDQDGHAPVDLKEVWFAGNHGDVGGGWPMEHGYLLSDTPLSWMVQEMLSCPGQGGNLAVLPAEVDNSKMQAGTLLKADQAGRVKKPIKAHDPLRYGYGSSRVMTFIWWIIELFPIMSRLELIDNKWVPRYFPPNLGSPRDIPADAVKHPSIDEMLAAGILDESMRPVVGGISIWDNVRRLFGLKPKVKKERGQANGERAA